MRKAALALLVLCCWASPALAQTDWDPVPVSDQTLVASELRSPDDFADGVFSWANAPGWVITEVTFGVLKGELVFARYTALPPGGQPKVHDRTAEVDWLIEDSKNLRSPIRLGVGDGRQVVVKSFTIGIQANGEAVIDSMEMEGAAAPQQAGFCGNPRVIGSCNAFGCSPGVCRPDFPDSDPCDCSIIGFCTDGSAQIVCPVGSCTGTCIFSSGLCGCFQTSHELMRQQQ